MELMAAKFALLSLCNNTKIKHIKIMIDNMTAVSYINHMRGSKSMACNSISREIWKWAETHKIWISAAHIPGVENTLADEHSRNFNDPTEWSLSVSIFKEITNTFVAPHIDLFANPRPYLYSSRCF